jgi:hypothetical protein
MTGCGLGAKEVGHGEHVRVRDVVDVNIVLQVCGAAKDERGCGCSDQGVNCGDHDGVVGAEYGGGAEGASGECGGGGGEDVRFCDGLEGVRTWVEWEDGKEDVCLRFVKVACGKNVPCSVRSLCRRNLRAMSRLRF